MTEKLSPDVAKKRAHAYEVITRYLEHTGVDRLVKAVSPDMPDMPLMPDGAENTKDSMLDFWAQSSTTPEDLGSLHKDAFKEAASKAKMLRELYDNAEKVRKRLLQHNIVGVVKDCRNKGQGDGKTTRLLIDITQDGFDEKIAKLAEEKGYKPINHDEIAAQLAEVIGRFREPMYQVSDQVRELYELADKLGVKKRVEALLSPREGMSRNVAGDKTSNNE